MILWLSLFLLVGAVFVPHQDPDNRLFVHYAAPFLSGGGYSSEALDFAMGLSTLNATLRLHLSQHGDSVNTAWMAGLPLSVREVIAPLLDSYQPPTKGGFCICHSEPGAWSAPTPNWRTPPQMMCPPPTLRGSNIYKIGRTMYETDRLPNGWRARLDTMDELWVPSEFHRRVFEADGLAAEKLFVLGESVDTDRFRPGLAPLSHARIQQYAVYGTLRPKRVNPCRFLSNGKWETRKNFEALLSAFAEVAIELDAELVILTRRFHSSADWSDTIGDRDPHNRVVLLEDVPGYELPRWYASGTAFVLPTRGEGWGRPFAEAMSTGLVVLATNYSGQTAFMDSENSRLLRYSLVSRENDDHEWAEVDVQHLKAEMRRVCQPEHREEMQRLGQRARKTMVDRFSIIELAKQIQNRLKAIQQTSDFYKSFK